MSNTKHKEKLCIVIPAFNEAAVIRSTIKDITKELQKNQWKYEIIIVDDGSRDQTATHSKSLGAKVISHIINSGAGSATATGLSYAEQSGATIAVTMDADGQHLPKDVIEGINQLILRKADLLIGSRLIDATGMSRVKRVGNRGLSFITYLLFGVNVTDSQSGLRIFSRRALEELRWKTNGYEFCSEMLWRAKQKNLVINEYPIEAIYTDYSMSKGQNNWNAFNIIKSLLRRRLTEVFGE